MITLYYVVEKELQSIGDNSDVEETTGNKFITLYDIDTQTISLIELCQINALNQENSEDKLLEWLSNNDYKDINLEML